MYQCVNGSICLTFSELGDIRIPMNKQPKNVKINIARLLEERGLSIAQAVKVCRAKGVPTTRQTLYNLAHPEAHSVSRRTLTALWVGLGITPAELFALE
jgi:hypothetical protein